MLYRNENPVLEFDDNPVAKLNPSNFAGETFDTDKIIITFFPEVIQKLLDQEAVREEWRREIQLCRLHCRRDAGGIVEAVV